MTTCVTRCPDEQETGDNRGLDQPRAVRLVWSQVTPWVWITACGRFKIERFVPGVIRDIALTREGPDRYRILKRTSEWYADVWPTETDLEVAKQACEGLANVHAQHSNAHPEFERGE